MMLFSCIHFIYSWATKVEKINYYPKEKLLFYQINNSDNTATNAPATLMISFLELHLCSGLDSKKIVVEI